MRTIKQEYYFPGLIALMFVLWGVDLILYSGSFEYTNSNIAGEIFSSWAVTVFAVNFLMATRLKWVERIFGGLDKMYMIHRRAGIIGFTLLVLHFIIVPRDPVFTIGKPMGFYALILITAGIVLSITPLFKRILKYRKWLNFHKLMGLFYILGIAHALNVPSLTIELPVVRTYVFGMAFIGIAAWFYKAFLYSFFNRKKEYSVMHLQRFENDVIEIILKPRNKKLNFEAGQFAFFSFKGISKQEQHPFTISNHPAEDNLRITVKALGDYTSAIQTSLKKGTQTKVLGPFGRFNYKYGRYKKQLWLAGGIGITPFLSFIRDIDQEYSVNLVWSINNSRDANYHDEIINLTTNKTNVKYRLNDSEKTGHFTIDRMYRSIDLTNYSVFICGPEVMRESFIKQLLQKGVSIRDIHYEDFGFR